jgi:uncharacterized membrane protein
MAHENAIADVDAIVPQEPKIRSINAGHLKQALVEGIADFNAMPTHYVFLALIYPVVTMMAARLYAGYDVLPLVFPLLAGYTLIGPIVAVGMYELSRRREKGLNTSRWKVFHVLQRHSIRSISILGALLMVIYFAWLTVAWSLWEANFGGVVPESVMGFVVEILTTPPGWTLIGVGGGAGFVFAVVVFSLSVVSFPMVLDHDVSVMIAMQTSVKAVMANPVTMAIWGIIVAVALLLGSLPFFIGLAVVMPILGHATWHVYRKVIEY